MKKQIKQANKLGRYSSTEEKIIYKQIIKPFLDEIVKHKHLEEVIEHVVPILESIRAKTFREKAPRTGFMPERQYCKKKNCKGQMVRSSRGLKCFNCELPK